MNESPYVTLIKSELIKKKKTQKEISGFYNFLPSVYNILMIMPYCCGELCDINDVELVRIQDLFQFFIYDAAFKVRNIINLLEIGSYCDAGILFRTFLETFIIYKYYILKKDGSGLSKYYEIDYTKRSKKRIKEIFEEIVPNFYDDLYAELCLKTHGNPLVQAIFRGNVSKDTPLKSNVNNINLDWFSNISNQLLPLIVGIIDLYKYVYPNNTLNDNKNRKNDLKMIYNFIYGDIIDREKSFPNQKCMIDYYNQIIKI